MDIHNLILVISAIALVFVNAFFVAAEFGMVKLRASHVQTIKDRYGLCGKILHKIHTHLDEYLSACQLGITLASLGLGWIGEPAFAYILQPIFNFLGMTSPDLIKISAFVIAFAIITFLHIVIGELMPKSLAIRKAEMVSIWTAIPLYIFYWLMYPAIFVLNVCSNFLLKLINLDTKKAVTDGLYSPDEIKFILHSSHLHGELTKEETQIMSHIMEFGDLEVSEIMRPFSELVMLDSNAPIHLLLEQMVNQAYSRYPLYDYTKKIVIGIVHVKDIFKELFIHKQIADFPLVIRPALRIQHDHSAMSLLRKFRLGITHLALVYEDQEIVGFVTLDNLLHVILGKITDEFHRTNDDWIKNEDGTISAKGICSLYSLERALGYSIVLAEDEEDVDTLSELILKRLAARPKPGDKVNMNDFDAIIEDMQGSDLNKILIIPKSELTIR